MPKLDKRKEGPIALEMGRERKKKKQKFEIDLETSKESIIMFAKARQEP